MTSKRPPPLRFRPLLSRRPSNPYPNTAVRELSQPTPTPVPAAPHLPAAKRKQKRYAWEALLPTFRFPPGFDVKGGGGGSLERQEADGGSTSVTAEATTTAGAAAAPARAPFSAPPVYQVRTFLKPMRWLICEVI